MDVIRRNTDYALRAMLRLARNYNNGTIPARQLAQQEGIPYQLACKLLQRLHRAGLVRSVMGPRGGFELSRKPAQVTLGGIVNAIQGPVSLNRCLLGFDRCPHQRNCLIRRGLAGLQRQIDQFLQGMTLADLLANRAGGAKTGTTARGRKRNDRERKR